MIGQKIRNTLILLKKVINKKKKGALTMDNDRNVLAAIVTARRMLEDCDREVVFYTPCEGPESILATMHILKHLLVAVRDVVTDEPTKYSIRLDGIVRHAVLYSTFLPAKNTRDA